MRVSTQLLELQLRKPFGISRGTVSSVNSFLYRLGEHGLGGATHVGYKGQKSESQMEVARTLAEGLTEENALETETWSRKAFERAPKDSAARAAFDITLHDYVGKKLGIPLYQYFGLPRVEKVSSYTIGIATDEEMVAKTEEAEKFPILKVKLGRDDKETDIRTMKALRKAAPNKTIRVDANAGWSFDNAKHIIKALADLNVEFVEQPLAIGNIEQLGKLHADSPLPILVDEDAQDSTELPRLIGKVDGIVIKLMKCGGLSEARRMIHCAETMGWKIMLGCMIETSLPIAAAAHLSAAVDYLDLDSEQLIKNNPCKGTVLDEAGVLHTPTGPGLGVSLAEGFGFH